MSPQIIVPKPCGACAYRLVQLTDGGRMLCDRCSKNRGLLSDQVYGFIRSVEKTFGLLTEHIVLRSADSTCAKGDRHLINLEEAEAMKRKSA